MATERSHVIAAIALKRTALCIIFSSRLFHHGANGITRCTVQSKMLWIGATHRKRQIRESIDLRQKRRVLGNTIDTVAMIRRNIKKSSRLLSKETSRNGCRRLRAVITLPLSTIARTCFHSMRTPPCLAFGCRAAASRLLTTHGRGFRLSQRCLDRPRPPLEAVVCFCSPTKSTGVPLETAPASCKASQFVRRTQPCDCVLPTFAGSGVP